MISALDRFFHNRRNLLMFGLVVTLAVTLIEVLRGTQHNFFTFQLSTFDFWRGADPYGRSYDFLYGPLFSILFAPFAWTGKTLGPFAWNLFNFALYFLAVFTLPDKYTERQKCRTYLFTALILATTQFSMQFNPVVAYVFIFAFSLLERGRAPLAILLILASGFIKIYGVFELALLVCYPRFWRNIGLTAAMAAGLFLLPVFRTGIDGLIPHYAGWFEALAGHADKFRFYSVFDINPLHDALLPAMQYVQAGSIAALAALFLLNRRRFGDFGFRAGSVGILMGWVILFSLGAEKHTYVIALAGYMMWHWVQRRRTALMQLLFWANFLFLVVVPVDVLCPPPVMRRVCDTLQLNIYTFAFTWLYMIYQTFIKWLLPNRLKSL